MFIGQEPRNANTAQNDDKSHESDVMQDTDLLRKCFQVAP